MNNENNFKMLKSLSLVETIKFLNKVSMDNWTPWVEWFDAEYCSACTEEKLYLTETGEEVVLKICEGEDFCPILNGELDNKNVLRKWLLSDNTIDLEMFYNEGKINF